MPVTLPSSFVWGPGGAKVSPETLAQQQKVIDALMASSDKMPTDLWSGLKSVTDTLVGNTLEQRHDDALAKAQGDFSQQFDALGDTPSRSQLEALAGNPWANDGQSAVVKALLAQNIENTDPEHQLDLELKRAQIAKDQRVTTADGEKWGLVPQAFNVKMPDGSTQVRIGVLSDQGHFKPVDLPDGSTPAFPVQQLDTKTQFVPKDKYGNDVPGTVPTTIDNSGAAEQTAIGKGTGEKIVALPEVKAADTGALQQFSTQVDQVIAPDIDKVIAKIDSDPNWTTGTLGQWLSGLGGTDAHDVAAALSTIGANVGFGELQQMRDNSKTGGALGSISDSEGALLRAVKGSIDQAQTKDQLKANLLRLKQLYQQVAKEKRQAFDAKYSGNAVPSAARVLTYNPETGELE